MNLMILCNESDPMLIWSAQKPKQAKNLIETCQGKGKLQEQIAANVSCLCWSFSVFLPEIFQLNLQILSWAFP